MDLDKILVAIFSLTGIAFTFWFFLLKKEHVVAVSSDSVDITVEGGYQPQALSIPVGKTTKLNFKRTDSSSCLEEVVISEFRIRRFLPLNKTVTVEITPQKKGDYPFSCGMNMFHGKVRVI